MYKDFVLHDSDKKLQLQNKVWNLKQRKNKQINKMNTSFDGMNVEGPLWTVRGTLIPFS